MAIAPTGYDGTVPRMDDGERLAAGMVVLGRDGERVGTIADIGRGFFLVEEGLFTITRMYLPRSIVARIAEGGVYLSVTKGEAASVARQTLPDAGDAWYGAPPSGIAPTNVRVMEIPLREQVLVTRAVATVTSEVRLRKGITEHMESVTTITRHEDAHVDSGASGNVHVEPERNEKEIVSGMGGTGAARTTPRPSGVTPS